MITRPAYIALLLAVPALAVAGCGNDDSASETSAARGVSGQQGTTRPRTHAPGTRDARPGQAGKPKQGSGKKSGAGGSNTGSAAPAEPAPPKKQADTRSLDPKELKQLRHGLSGQARFTCKEWTLEGLAEDYRVKSGKPDDVARAFAAGYPVGLRQAVAAGCKAGLLESK